jgi:hypothetical protein
MKSIVWNFSCEHLKMGIYKESFLDKWGNEHGASQKSIPEDALFIHYSFRSEYIEWQPIRVCSYCLLVLG